MDKKEIWKIVIKSITYVLTAILGALGGGALVSM